MTLEQLKAHLKNCDEGIDLWELKLKNAKDIIDTGNAILAAYKKKRVELELEIADIISNGGA